jgi:glycosyltransferase involved in cell wall biosynthesis
VSTTIGCEGIAARPGEDVLIADMAADFAAATVRLLRDRALAEKLRSNGRRLAEEMYDWRAIASRLDALYR